jgi:hypothetical protein
MVARDWSIPPEYLAIFPRIRVLILGSYAPDKIGIIRNVKKMLTESEGLSNSRMVCDFFTPPRLKNETKGSYNLRKSEYWLNHADVYLFIFLGDTDSGVMYELSVGLLIPGGPSRSIVAYARDKNVTSLLEGIRDKYRREISEISFDDPDSIGRQVAGYIAEMSSRLYATGIKYRPIGEWETSS